MSLEGRWPPFDLPRRAAPAPEPDPADPSRRLLVAALPMDDVAA